MSVFRALLLLAVILTGAAAVEAQAVTDLCPIPGLRAQPSEPLPGGLIVTNFDRRNLWVYNVDRGNRYPIEGTRPCKSNCHLSPDGYWLTVYNAAEEGFDKMLLDGSSRQYIARRVTDVEWWSADTLLVWTAAQTPALQQEGSDEREVFAGVRVYSVQPGGRWALAMKQDGDAFVRELVDLDDPARRAPIGADTPYFNAVAWSPDGRTLAYVQAIMRDGVPAAEIFAVDPGMAAFPAQWTQLAQTVGAVRIGGESWVNSLSWSPDGRTIAFWLTESTSLDPAVEITAEPSSEITPEAAPPVEATLYTLDVNSRRLTRYCGLTTRQHLPNPPRLVWSPDSSHIAFGTDIEDNPRGNLLIALNVASGEFIELSSGVNAVLGAPDVVAWGWR
jgi:dipeptidyl aminopeptidase/acylaminoacyl peptidase